MFGLKTNRHCYTALEIEASKADIEACLCHATRELVATNPRASMPKKKETDPDLLRASLAIFLN